MKKTILFILLALIAVPCFSQVVTRFPNGVSTADIDSMYANLGTPNRLDFHEYFDDFEYYTAAATEWVVSTTEEGTGSATEATGDYLYGAIVITNATGDNDEDIMNRTSETLQFELGKKLWFESRVQVSDASNTDWFVGLVSSQVTVPETSLINLVTGTYFLKADGSESIGFYTTNLGSSSTATGISTNVSNTYVSLGFYYDGANELQYFVDGTRVGTIAATNISKTDLLAPAFGVRNGEAAAKTMTVDYIWAIKER